ncbi:MAG: NUDIX domain-containing protein [Chloroflexi bacterium]|nr:NUDIX domain-containing protein [Chloroflexota bacterium]
MENLDIYDENLTWLGTKERGAVHRDGDWHRVFQCWVIFRDAQGRDWIVMQRRGAEKDFFPNLLDVSAAGHYAAGETMRDGVREIEEELGIRVTFDDLIPVGRRVGIARQGALIDHEIADVFLYVCDKPLREYDYQREEVAGLVAFDVDEGLALFARERDTLEAQAVGLGQDAVTLTRADFVPTKDAYVYKILVLAKRCLNGEKHLVV